VPGFSEVQSGVEKSIGTAIFSVVEKLSLGLYSSCAWTTVSLLKSS
jgi:hypothetical protein